MNPFGQYIIIESDLSNHALERVIAHTAKVQPRSVIVSTGGQPDRAQQTLERLRSIAPNTILTYRQWPNDGIIKTFGYNGAALYTERVKPLVNWLKQYRINYHLDNESSENDMRPYSDATATAITLADNDGIGLDVASFATGNIPIEKYNHLDSMWRALAKSPRSRWCPHEYYDTTPQGSAGHVFRFIGAWKYCDSKGIKRPDTCIQEYGLLVSNDPEAGWRRTSMSGRQAARQGIGYYDSWYQPEGVSVVFYAFCGMDVNNSKWKDCSTDDDGFLAEIESYIPKGTPMPIPETDPRWLANPQMHLRSASASKVNVRSEPNTKAAIVTSLQPAIEYTVGYIPYGKLTAAEIALMTDGYVWHSVKIDQLTGWIRQDVVLLTEIPAPPPEDSEEEAARKYRLELYSMIDYDLSQAFSKLAILKSVDERLEDKENEI